MKKLNLYEAIQKLKSLPYEEWYSVLINLLNNKSDSRIPLENEKHIFYIIDYIQNARIYEPKLKEIIEKSQREYRAYDGNEKIEELSKALLNDNERIKHFREDREILKKKRKKELLTVIYVSSITTLLTKIIIEFIF